jgi:hypothetical protein
MSINKLYTQEIKKETAYSAIWFPNITVQPGDVGKLIDYTYNHVCNLNNFDVDFDIIENSNQMDFSYSSADSVTIEGKLSGHAALPGSSLSLSDVGVMVRFSKDKAIVFRLAKCKSTMIDNMKPIEDKIMSLYKTGKWEKNMVVVTEAVKAHSATIIISNSHDAAIDLLAKGTFNLAKIDLADIGAEFEVVKRSNIATEIIASQGLTPLFKTCGIKLSIFRKVSPGYQDEYVGSPYSGNYDFELGVRSVDYSDFDEG